MKNLSVILSILLLILISNEVFGQRNDTLITVGMLTGDTILFVRENIPKHKLLGNSWYTGVAYNFSKSHEFTLNFGRTYGKGVITPGMFNFCMESWGIGYSYFIREQTSGQTLSGFGEVSNFFLPPATARLEYLYDFNNNNHYLRPSLGLNIFLFDILYSYSFKIYGEKNSFKHGLTLRFKYFIGEQDWEKTHPIYPNR